MANRRALLVHLAVDSWEASDFVSFFALELFVRREFCLAIAMPLQHKDTEPNVSTTSENKTFIFLNLLVTKPETDFTTALDPAAFFTQSQTIKHI